jgi:multiple sugar transport system permease protein
MFAHHKRAVAAKAATYGVLWLWAIVCVFPLYWVALASIKGAEDLDGGPAYLPFVDFMPSLDAWRFILTDKYENLVMRFVNSAVVAASATLLALTLGGLAAYGLSRFRPRVLSGSAVMAAILATRILPPMVMVLPLYVMFNGASLLDTRTALVITYGAVNLPVAVWLLRPVFGPRASDQEEAALLDGASRFRIFFEIAVPMAAGGIAAAGILIFILCWNEYLFAAILTSNEAMTVPPWMVGQLSMKEAQVGGGAEEWSNLSAATILMTAPLLLVTVFAQRALARMV